MNFPKKKIEPINMTKAKLMKKANGLTHGKVLDEMPQKVLTDIRQFILPNNSLVITNFKFNSYKKAVKQFISS